MNSHYNAFISYRHHPDDIKVASEIHRSLERFHAPRSIRKKYGKITRLFRDKEELPITSDLNDDIDDALRNSDYLIVICSVHLKESIWCQREIERFLKTHPRNRVLTVLASGEPYDVIPDILLHEDVVDPETGETHRIDIEPLSCDWRVKRRKAKQEELLRLVAPLLGCAYDELRQRQKQYKTRRNAAIVSSALLASFSLTAYFIYTSITIPNANIRIQAQNEEIQAQNDEIQAQNEEIKEANVQIQKNLDEALINQSRHLTTAAQEQLAEGDRLTALTLAMAALPSETNVRPYVPEAERVLVEALAVYDTYSQISAVGTVSPGANVQLRDYCVSDSEKIMYLLDHRHIITVWDTETLQKVSEITLTNAPDSMTPLNNENLLVHGGMGSGTVNCYQPDGTMLWQLDHCLDVTYLLEQDQILVICENDSGIYELLCIDAATGEKIGQPLDLTLADPEFEAYNFVTTPNADVALICYYNFKGFTSSKTYYAVDLHTGKTQHIDLETPDESIITSEGKFVSMGFAEGSGMSGFADGDRMTSIGTKTISCYDLHTGSLLWENTITSPVAGVSSGIYRIHGSNDLLCTYGNVLMIVDGQTGETIAECGTGGIIMAVKETHAGDSVITLLLQDGYVGSYIYAYNTSYEEKVMEDNVSSAVVMDNFYVFHWQEDHVTIYRNIAGTPAWEGIVEGGLYSSNSNLQIYGNYLAFQESKRQFLFDLEKKTFLYILENEQKDLLGFSSDGKKLWYKEGNRAIIEMDIATGNYETMELQLSENERISGSFLLYEDCLYYMVRDYSYENIKLPQLVCWDLKTGETTSCSVQLETEDDITSWYWETLQIDGTHAWILGRDKVLVETDLRTGKSQIIVSEVSHRPVVAMHPDQALAAISTNGNIYLKKPGQDIFTVIPLENANAGSMYFYEDLLLALCDNGFVYRYDLSGKLLGQTELLVDSTFSQKLFSSNADLSRLSWKLTKNNDLVVNAFGAGNVIDCDTWTVKATISDLLLYSEVDNSLVCKLGKGLCGYTLYTTEQLLELTRETLGSFQMTQEQKDAYGID